MSNKATVLKEICRGCGICAFSCPQNAITIIFGKAEVDKSKCIGCRRCTQVCPVKAIVITPSVDKEEIETFKKQVRRLKERITTVNRRIKSLLEKRR